MWSAFIQTSEVGKIANFPPASKKIESLTCAWTEFWDIQSLLRRKRGLKMRFGKLNAGNTSRVCFSQIVLRTHTALIGMMPQFNQPATCLLRKTTGSICSAAGCWVEMFFVFCELWLIVDGALFFTVAVLVEGGGIGLRPAALAKNALFVSHVGSWEKRMTITNIILSFRQCSPLTWK